MRTFDEQFTAWVDGRLQGAELAAFERQLKDHPEALAEKEACLAVGNLLRSQPVPPLKNVDFFNHQILRQIAQSSQPAPRARRSLWTLPRMALSGAFLLVVASVLYFAAVPSTRRDMQKNATYVDNVLNAKSDDPAITATSFRSKEDNADVLWLDNMSYSPAQDHKQLK
jgi:anti-sigma factor RsiW